MKKAAEAGNLDAKYNLARWYRFASGVKRNYPKALALYEEADSEGFLPASFDLGEVYVFGLMDVSVDYPKAREFLKKAASLYPLAYSYMGYTFDGSVSCIVN